MDDLLKKAAVGLGKAGRTLTRLVSCTAAAIGAWVRRFVPVALRGAKKAAGYLAALLRRAGHAAAAAFRRFVPIVLQMRKKALRTLGRFLRRAALSVASGLRQLAAGAVQKWNAVLRTEGKRGATRLVLPCLCLVVAIVGTSGLVGYLWDHFRHKSDADAMRIAYYSDEELAESGEDRESDRLFLFGEDIPEAALYFETDEPVPKATPTPWTAPAAQAAPTPRGTPEPKLQLTDYPANPNRTISARFRKLQRQNRDIVGFLHIDDMLDEVVVQRDNEYYLRRDYRGYHNTNGALFLDEGVNLRHPPAIFLVYGHNMRTGAMFGNLRHFEDSAYAAKHGLISWDTQYENGTYVVFAAGEIDLRPGNRYFVDLFAYEGGDYDTREHFLRGLRYISRISVPIEVLPTDRLLLMVTCASDDNVRRVVAARRLRAGERSEDMLRLLGSSR